MRGRGWGGGGEGVVGWGLEGGNGRQLSKLILFSFYRRIFRRSSWRPGKQPVNRSQKLSALYKWPKSI